MVDEVKHGIARNIVSVVIIRCILIITTLSQKICSLLRVACER